MQRPLVLCSLAALLLPLAACSRSSSVGVSLETRLGNPLFAYAYEEDLVQHMTNLSINDDPVLKDPSMRAFIDNERRRSLEAAHEADAKRKGGIGGDWVRIKEEVRGHALLLPGDVYLSPDFIAPAGVALHVYVSTLVDPRDGSGAQKFPGKGSMDLGPLQTSAGEQEYAVPAPPSGSAYRSVVLYDPPLKRIYGFVQLKKEL